MDVKEENEPHVLEIKTLVVERNVRGVEVIDIHKLNALQRMKYAITAKRKVTSLQFAEAEVCQLLGKKTTLRTQHS